VIRDHLFVLAVPDLARSGAFYRDVLGFEVHEMGDPGWRMFVRDRCRIMAGECPDAMPAGALGDHSYFAYLVVDDVDAYHARALAAGADVTKAVRDEPWGMREFGLRTVDGHRLMVASRIVAPL
jgi:predicted enzyme related to lactoylglutathione lyase